jgi:hypothetical protein
MMIPLQIQVLMAWTAAKDTLIELADRARRDERGELPATVIFMVALAVAAVTIAAVVIQKINAQTDKLP